MSGSDYQWSRFNPVERFLRFSVYLLSEAAIVFSIRTVEVIPEFILDAPHQMMDLLSRMWPMDTGHYAGGGGPSGSC